MNNFRRRASKKEKVLLYTSSKVTSGSMTNYFVNPSSTEFIDDNWSNHLLIRHIDFFLTWEITSHYSDGTTSSEYITKNYSISYSYLNGIYLPYINLYKPSNNDITTVSAYHSEADLNTGPGGRLVTGYYDNFGRYGTTSVYYAHAAVYFYPDPSSNYSITLGSILLTGKVKDGIISVSA